MVALTDVTLTAGLGTGGTGTVSTLDKFNGTAGTPTTQVLTVQGVASGTAQPVSIATAPVLVAGSAIIGKVGIDQTTDGTTNKVAAGGDIAAAASDSGNPVKIGGLGKTANPTAVTDGQRANALFDKLGKQIVVGSIRDLKGNQFTTITSSTSETTVVTAVASTFLDVYGCIIENTSATASKVTFKDSTAGTTQFEIYVPAGDTRGFVMPESAAFKQTTVNNNWTATCGTSVASIVITMLYVKNL